MLLPTPGTCLQFTASILPLLLKALFINMVIIDLASVNQRNPCASEITVFLSNTSKASVARSSPEQCLSRLLAEILGGKPHNFYDLGSPLL